MSEYKEKIMDLKKHKWEIVHFEYNISLYMDDLFICDLKSEEEISGYIRDEAFHIRRNMIDLPADYFKK